MLKVIYLQNYTVEVLFGITLRLTIFEPEKIAGKKTDQ